MTEAITISGVRLTSPDKVLYPDQGLTKRELADYFVKVAHRMLPYAADHPLTIVRCPQGLAGHCFYQRHLTEGMPEGFHGVPIPGRGGEKSDFLYIKDVKGLVGAAQIGALELHVWGAPVSHVRNPDRLVLDLDPSDEVPFADVKAAAKEVRGILKSAGLESFPLVTGGKGIHVIAPLAGENGWDEVKSFAEAIARGLERADPERFIAQASKAKRKGRIFVDWLRNDETATAIAPYSPRARKGAPVAMPISWSELQKLESSAAFDTASAMRRAASKKEPWPGYENAGRISRATLAAAEKAIAA
jgi:bifunctional non-homologous end joining protein LigD